ncbi:MAG: hypothetical protein JWP91_458 [Fibrobacteres bacterium]|nr:hypothetical protein [Fibrobacterota bacterium]
MENFPRRVGRIKAGKTAYRPGPAETESESQQVIGEGAELFRLDAHQDARGFPGSGAMLPHQREEFRRGPWIVPEDCDEGLPFGGSRDPALEKPVTWVIPYGAEPISGIREIAFPTVEYGVEEIRIRFAFQILGDGVGGAPMIVPEERQALQDAEGFRGWPFPQVYQMGGHRGADRMGIQ